MGQLAAMEKQGARQRRKMLGAVAMVVNLFAQQRRNDTSAQAITDYLNMPASYPLELVTELLAEYHEIKAGKAADADGPREPIA